MSYSSMGQDTSPTTAEATETKVVKGHTIRVVNPTTSSQILGTMKFDVGREKTVDLYGISVPGAAIIDPPPPGVYLPKWIESVKKRGLGMVAVKNPEDKMPGYLVATRDVALVGKLMKATPSSVVFFEPSSGWNEGDPPYLTYAAVAAFGVGLFYLSTREVK